MNVRTIEVLSVVGKICARILGDSVCRGNVGLIEDDRKGVRSERGRVD